jgi:hypothetical protein
MTKKLETCLGCMCVLKIGGNEYDESASYLLLITKNALRHGREKTNQLAS